jgi:outer membrane protein TolC
LAVAQQPQGDSFTLEQCIQYALENSVNVKNAVLDERIATARVKETIGIGLPQVNGSASVMHNQKLARFFATYSENSFFFGGQPIPGVNEGDVVAAQNFFQLKSSGSASLAVNQILFNGSYLVGLQASNAFKELRTKTTGQTKEQLIAAVTKAYYLALVNRERISLFDANIARVDSLFSNTKALNANGFAENIDVDRIQVTMNNLTTERDKFIKLQELSVELLKFQMNYPMDSKLEIVGNISEQVAQVDLNSYLTDWDYKNRWDYQVLETNRKLQSLNLKNQYAANLPSLVAFANMGYSTQSPTVGGIFKTNTSISDNGSLGPDKWYSFSNFGVSLSVPIFSGLQRNYKIQQEKLTLQKIENGVKNFQAGIDLEIKSSTIMYQNSIQSLQSQQRNMDLAKNVARVTKIKYEQGVGSNLEVINAEASLKEAQINYYNALYDALVAKTDLDKAFGKLLPVAKN